MTDNRSALSPLVSTLLAVASGVAVLAGMRAAASIIGPVIIALIITIAWSPGSEWLRRKGWHPSVAALTGIVLGVIGMGLFVALVWSSLIQLQDNLPTYQTRVEALQQTITAKLSDLPIDSSRLFSGEMLRPSALVGYAVGFVRQVTSAVGNLFFLVLLMAFMMLEAVRYPQKLRDALATSSTGVEQFNRFSVRIREYVVINSVFGLIAATLNTVLLLLLGIDYAILWGVLSFLLSFVPNIGFAIALVPPALLALVQFGFARAGIVIAGYTLINFLVDNVFKPRFVGESLDLSALVVVLSLLFWGWLLGPIGALIAIPLSIATKFLFEGFEESRWLAHLMSDQGLTPAQVVAGDTAAVASTESKSLGGAQPP
ncbi:MAG: AI-2E family transporter [Gemmatimonadaceae bacterium]|nr:AI-2E family transporter [Gemmatimonadaceae bacterium]